MKLIIMRLIINIAIVKLSYRKTTFIYGIIDKSLCRNYIMKKVIFIYL